VDRVTHGIIMSYLYVRAPALCLADVISSVFVYVTYSLHHNASVECDVLRLEFVPT